MNEIDTVFAGDSYGAVFSWSKPSAANPNIAEDANPTAATFSVVRSRNGQAVALEDDTATISGNETTATVPAGILRTGGYRLYVTATFADETTLTRSRAVRVLAKDGTN
jgi:hypothetical protein